MGNYKNGLETKESLYRSAKKIFYQKGYEKTTIKDIITDAKTKQGLLNYYFGAKENLAVQIYKDFSNDVVFCIDEKKDALPALDNGLLTDMVGYRAYFQALFTNPAVIRFYEGVSKLPLFADTLVEMRDYFFSSELEKANYRNYNPKLKDKAYFEYMKSLSAGMEIQIFRNFLEKNIPANLDQIIDWFLYDYYCCLFTNQSFIEENLEKARNITASFSFEVNEYFELTFSPE